MLRYGAVKKLWPDCRRPGRRRPSLDTDRRPAPEWESGVMTDVNFGELSAEEAAREAYARILARAPEHDFEPTLDRVREACALLGDPEAAFRVIHVTGTNGKTSTSRMIERLVRAHGLRTGRFTSPHLTTVRERIAIDGEPISAGRFVEVWQEVAPIIHI